VHTDVWGPFPILAKGGHRYFVTVLDDHTSVSAITLLKSKDQAGEAIQEMLAKLETKSGKKVKVLRSDRGGEYVSKRLQAWLAERGIEHQPSAAYTPEQNGRAERLNRTLNDKVRALFQESGLPFSLWGEAVITACYLRNRSPVRGQDATPLELFTGQKPDVGHLRVFGCVAYALTPFQRREHKLGPVSSKGYMVGYTATTANYRVYLPESGTVVETSDVRFDETVRFSSPSHPPMVLFPEPTPAVTNPGEGGEPGGSPGSVVPGSVVPVVVPQQVLEVPQAQPAQQAPQAVPQPTPAVAAREPGQARPGAAAD